VKSEAVYRLYALYDKMYRSDILFDAWSQCRSDKGAPGVDRQDFQEVEKYGVLWWLGKLELALKTEKYQPEPIRRFKLPGCRHSILVSASRLPPNTAPVNVLHVLQ
jgi:hypothetical protein